MREDDATNQLKQWVEKKRNFDARAQAERLTSLAHANAEESFSEFLTLWEFFWEGREAAGVLFEPLENFAHREKMAAVFSQLRRYGFRT